MMIVYNKQWKRVFEITHVNEHNQPVDTLGIIHEKEALRGFREVDKEPFLQYR